MPPRKNKKNYRGKKKNKSIASIPRQIQNATYMPKNRLVKFSGYRSFIVVDNEGIAAAYCPVLEIAANNPRKLIHNTQGAWLSNSMGGKGAAVAGLAQWLTNKAPTSSATGSYLNAQALSCRVTITAIPCPIGAVTADYAQDSVKMCVQNNTRGGNMLGKSISSAFNSEVCSQTVGMKTCNLYTNHHGTPRGGTISMNYSFKKQNAGVGVGVNNTFWLDTDPNEKDFINVAFLPGDSNGYGLTGTRNPDLRVEVKVSYIVLLSEPNTAIQNSELNDGLDLPRIPHRVVENIEIGR